VGDDEEIRRSWNEKIISVGIVAREAGLGRGKIAQIPQ